MRLIEGKSNVFIASCSLTTNCGLFILLEQFLNDDSLLRLFLLTCTQLSSLSFVS